MINGNENGLGTEFADGVSLLSETANRSLRLLVVPRRHSQTVACRAFVKCGSRHDGSLRGLAHLLEHMLFRGTQHYKAEELFYKIEGLGGKIKVGTGKEYTSVGFVLPAQEVETGLEVVADVIANPLFPARAFDEEKAIIANEIAATRDQQQVLWDMLAYTLWQHHPLRYSISGDVLSLAAIGLPDLWAHYRRHFQPSRSVLVIVGDVEPASCVQAVERLFAAYKDGAGSAEQEVTRIEPPLDAVREAHLEKDTHQSHLLIGWPIGGMDVAERQVYKLLESILGRGGSSRLYRSLRMNGGLVYGVSASTTLYEDVGYFAIYTTCDPQDLPNVHRTILAEVKKLGQEPIAPDELRDAQRQYEGSLLVNFETNYRLAGLLGTDALLHRVQTCDELRARVQAVSVEDMLTTAHRYLSPERYVAVTAGRKNGFA